MIDITHKSNTLRKAIAEATVSVSSDATIALIINNMIPKGNVFNMAKVAGLFGVKRTSDMIPDCHPKRFLLAFNMIWKDIHLLI